MKSINIMIALIVISATCISCHRNSISQSAIHYNTESIDSRGNLMLLGKSTRERLQQEPFGSWFNKNYADYKTDTIVADQLKPFLQNKRFIIFMGTWCGDSKKEVPKMYKLLDYCGMHPSQIELINVDIYDSVYKQSPTHEERGLNIHRVPDLLIYENKKEIGRIVESPVVSLEKDLLAIVSGSAYQPHYKAVIHLFQLFKTSSLSGLENDIQTIASTLKPIVKNRAELNSYGHVLMAAKEPAKAIFAFKLNSLLYPNDANVFNSLAEAYWKTGNKEAAKENYKKVLSIEPANEKALKRIADL